MNIFIDTNASPTAKTIESSTTSYRPQAVNGNSMTCGYSLDIADKVMDNGAYQSQGKTNDDITKAAEGTDTTIQKNYMVVMSNTVSSEDLQKMQEDGYDAGSTDVETYVNIVDKIKVTLAKAGVNVEGFTDNIDADVAKEILGNEISVNALFDSLKEADLPVTEEVVKSFGELKEEASNIEGLSDDALKFMILNKKEINIDNLYIASFSSAGQLKQASGYFGETIGNAISYYARKSDEKSLVNLEEQIDGIIKESGLEVNEETRSQAKWLILSGIECNKENLTKLSDLESINFPIEDETLITVTINALKQGTNPKKMSLVENESIDEKAKRVLDEVNSITDEAITIASKSDKTINIKELYTTQKQLDNKEIEAPKELYQTDDIKTIETRAQLEEIRLMMTIKANKDLIKKGIQIDVTPLSDLVDELKETIKKMKESLYCGESEEENNKREEEFITTIQKTNEIKNFPAALIGIHKDIQTFSLEKLHEEGRNLALEYEKLGKTFEEVMTKPRSDLGDKISKAFRNVDDILSDLKLEVNEANRRAVRILGYNSMEITPENIANVKEADQSLNQVIKRMNPATTLQMIRDQKNPLEMSLEEINTYLDDKEDEKGQSEEKFSRFLQKLDRSGKISEEEKKAYKGIYRMFRQIEKSDGAAIGNLVSTKMEINFKNMLLAIRSQGKNVNVKIDEEFGALEKLIQNNSSISGDINQAYKVEGANQSLEYYASLSAEITSDLSSNVEVEDLSKITIQEQTTIEGFSDELKKQVNQSTQKVDYKEFQRDILEAQDVEEAVMQKLIDLDLPISIDNLMATSELLLNRGSFFKGIFKDMQKDDELDKAKEELVEDFTDSKKAKKAYENLVNVSRKKVHSMTDSSQRVIDINAYKSMCKVLSVANKLAKKESYEIPVEIEGEMTSVNLEIYHDSQKRGKISITFETGELGKVAAELTASEEKISGMMVYENKPSQSRVEQIKENFEEEIQKCFDGEVKKNISLIQTKTIDFNSFGIDKDMDSALPTNKLYEIAKGFLIAVQRK